MKINLKKSFVIGILFVLFSLQYADIFAVTTIQTDVNDISGTKFTSTTYNGCVSGTKKDFTEVFTYLLCVMDSGIIPLLISIGLIIFLAGVIRFVSAGDDEEKRQGGRQMMIFGIIALFVMVGVWGFVNMLSNTFFGKNSELQTLPKKGSSIYLTQ